MIELTKIEKQNDMEVMKKKLCIIMSAMLLMLAGTVMTACSSDDDVDFIKVDFQLQNEDGIECSSRGDRYLSHSSRHTQVPVPATTWETLP